MHILADLWNSPDAANTLGCSTTGSSEVAMKWRWREKMRATGKPTDKPNMICGPVPTLGVTFTCQYEPVKAVSDALDKL